MADVRSVWLCLLFTLPTYAQPPVLKQGGVVNAASFAEAVSPGSLVSIFGENMSTHALAAISMPLPTSLGGVKVYLSNTPAPLIFVSSGQINAQVPWEVAGAEALDVTVWTNDISSNTITVPFANAAPGIFTSSGPGYDLGEVTIGNTDVVAGPRRVRPFYARPVKRGEYLVVYATGLGAVSHTPETGHMTKGNPVAITTTPVTVSFGDRTLVPTFAGLTPGFVGLWQVNVRVPDDMPAGSKVPLAITVDGVTSNTVMIAVSDEPVWQIGNGGITGVRFTDRTPAVSRPIIDKLVWQAVPIMDRIFGPPADAIVLTVDTGCGWNYDGVTQTLCAGAPPTDPDETEGFANIFYHELAHAYTVSARWNDGQRSTPNWFLEGVADAVDELTILYLNQIGATAYRNINDLINLGLYSLGGPEIVGGSWGRAFKQTRIGSALNTYAAYELFLMLATTQSSATSGVWMNYTALADLKAELYWLSNIRQGAPTYGDFLRAVERTCRYPIDGLPAVEWVKRQPVTHTDGTPGTYFLDPA